MQNAKFSTFPPFHPKIGGGFLIGDAPAVLDKRRSRAPLWEIPTSRLDRNCVLAYLVK